MEPTVRRFEVQVLNEHVKRVTGREERAVFGTWQPDEREQAEQQCRRLLSQGYLARVGAQEE